MLKDWWPALLLAVLGLTFLAFWAGAVAAFPPISEDAPHGVFEYYTHRYQTVIAAMLTVSGAALILRQIAESKKQHAANMKHYLRDETDALDTVDSACKKLLEWTADDIIRTMARHTGAAPRIPFLSLEDINDLTPKLTFLISRSVRNVAYDIAHATNTVDHNTTEPNLIMEMYFHDIRCGVEAVKSHVNSRRAHLESLVIT